MNSNYQNILNSKYKLMDNYNNFETSYSENPLDDIDINSQLDGGYGNSNNDNYKQYAPLNGDSIIIPKRKTNNNTQQNMYRMDTNLINNNNTNTNNSNKFYQICLFSNPKTKKYSVKRFITNTNTKKGVSKFTSISEKKLNKNEFKKLINSLKPHQYNTYYSWDLSNVEPPILGNVITNSSELLNNDYDYSGFAPF